MSQAPRQYIKLEGSREPKLPLPVESVIPPGADALQEKTIEAYQKAEGIRPVRSFWVIISGGQKRERDYFKILSNQERFNRIKLEFIADPNKLQPQGMLEIADNLNNRFQTSWEIDSEPDKIYLISDVDDFMNELIEIKPKCEESGYKLIISNSCFEIWLFYAFCDKIIGFNIPDNPLKISGKFKGWADGYIKGGLKPIQAIFSIKTNIENAKKNYQEDENKIPRLFSTNMHLLAEEILPLIEEELIKLKEENKKREEKYRTKKQ